MDEQLPDTLSSPGTLTISMSLGQDSRTLVLTWQLSILATDVAGKT